MKKIISILLSILFIVILALTAFAQSGHPPRLVDEADLLSSSEESDLLGLLNEISERQQFDVVVVTVYSLGGKTPQDYADDYYDYNGYGMGQNNDGILLLVSMEYRDWYICTTGFGIDAFSDSAIDYIADNYIVPYLSRGDYYSAFVNFANKSDSHVTQVKNGNNFNFGIYILLAVAVGFIVGLIVVSIMKGKMKSVRRRNNAAEYKVTSSMKVTDSRDIYLYSTVTKTAIPKNNSSGGSGHFSSSGTSHGGGGGKF